MNMLRPLLHSLLLVAFCLTVAEAQPKKRIAVARFSDGAAYHGCGVGISDMLATALVKSGKFLVVERKDLEKVLDEQKLGASGIVTAETAPAMGRVLGVDMIVVGSVSELVEDGVTGYLVENEDAAGLEEKIRALLAHADRAREFGSRGRAIVEKDFPLETMVRKREELFASLLC